MSPSGSFFLMVMLWTGMTLGPAQTPSVPRPPSPSPGVSLTLSSESTVLTMAFSNCRGQDDSGVSCPTPKPLRSHLWTPGMWPLKHSVKCDRGLGQDVLDGAPSQVCRGHYMPRRMEGGARRMPDMRDR